MIRCLTREKRGKRGFTMMEVLVVVGIIAVIAAIAIPSVISMRKNMDYKQRCDYAKTIFLAAQSNLADLRSTGELKLVEDASNSHGAVLQQEDAEKAETEEGGTTGNLPGGFVSRYIYTANFGGTADDRYAQVLPVNAVESTIRDQNVIIEYNPRTGIVHAVFYAEGNYDLLGNYQKGMLKRDEQWLKENLVGYYGTGDADVSEELGFKTVSPEITFENGQEAILTVKIPTRTDKSNEDPFFLPDKYGYYVKGLEINLTVAGENSGVFTKNLKKAGVEMQPGEIDADEGAALVIPLHFALDSLADGKGFYDIPENKGGEGYHVLPGDNVSLFVEVSYVPTSQNDPLIMYDDAVLAGVNPLFHALTGEAPNYTVAISNGRHMQNLNALHSDIAGKVNTVTFLAETAGESAVVDWASTVSYYQQNHAAENLKCFVPIENNGLFNRGTENSLLIKGDNAVISNLKIIDTTPEKYVGLFRTLNGVNLENLRIVDPVIRGGDAAKAQKGVGTLAGAVQNSKITNCYVYIDIVKNGTNSAFLNLGTNFGDTGTTEQHYGVVGCTAVGGMVGHSVDTDFKSSFAAVPVYGNMDGANGSNVGVGGFVGAANGGSFTKCYTSVHTLGKGAFAEKKENSCGLGGFVGTSTNAGYTHCFTSGDVVCKGSSYLAASGGFAGIVNGNGKYEYCYSLGTVHHDTKKAKFVGSTFETGIEVSKQDFYKAKLANSTKYIFRDCYYLQGKPGVLNDDKHALPASFDMLYNLYAGSESDDEYIFSALYSETMLTAGQADEFGDIFKTSAYKNSGNWMQGYKSKTDGNGYYSYSNGTNGNYPYSMLTNMPFCGIWPDAPSDVRMAYVEIYHDGNMGIYFDKSDIDDVPLGKTVIADGYAIMSANGGGNVEVTFNDASKGIPLIFTYTDVDSRNEYYYGFIPVNAESLVNTFSTSGSFYTKVELYDSELLGERKEYRMYFNPYVALSQKNPTKPKTEASDPGAPADIYIHSARQLNALATKMSAFWNLDYNLIGTIDFDRYGLGDTELAKYGFDSKTVGNYGIIKYDLASIGTEANPFTGTLTGEYDATVKVQGTAATDTAEAKVGAKTGLIGVLGANGQVSGITITGTMELGNNEGALVNVMNGGTLKDCAVNAVITSDSETAGLVVGELNGGEIINCTFDDTDVESEMKTSTHLGFVGVAKMTGYVAVDKNAKYFTKTEFKESSIAESKIESTFTKITDAETAKKRAYAGKIDEDCFFTVNGKTTPAVETEIYYYSISEDEEYKKSDTPATEFVAVSSVKPSEFGTGNTEWKPTGYYYMTGNKYYPVSVKVTAVEKQVFQPFAIAENDNSDPADPTQESTGTNESTTKTVYFYEFGYNDKSLYTSSEIEDTETPITLPADLPLYRLNIPVKGKTYMLVDGTGQALTGENKSARFDGGIKEEMIWTVGENGVWTNKTTAGTIQVALSNVSNGAEQYPKMKIGNIEYTVYAVSENTERNVELVDRDCEYVTTESLVSESEES